MEAITTTPLRFTHIPQQILNQPPKTRISLRATRRRLQSIKAGRDASSDNTGNDGDTTLQPPPPITPPETVEVRFRRGSRKQRQQQQEGVSAMSKPPPPPKDWESMTMTEKALELYMGEKGLLFWINKFAYASIFIVIGAWILFRFVGPSVGLYQLDAPTLSPSNMFKS